MLKWEMWELEILEEGMEVKMQENYYLILQNIHEVITEIFISQLEEQSISMCIMG